MNERSLENLKLGAQARYQGKIRQNVSILPETLEWLKKSGNASSRIDELVKAAKSGDLKSEYTQHRKTEEQQKSDNVYNQIQELKTEIERLRQERDHLQQDCDQLATELAASQQQIKNQPLPLPSSDAARDRALSKWKSKHRVGEQSSSYKQVREAMNLLLKELNQSG